MRNKLAVIITCLLVLTMGTTVFADADGAPSVTSKDQEAEAYKNKITALEISSGTVSYNTVKTSVMDEAKAEAVNAGKVDSVLAMADVHPSEDVTSKGLTVTFRIADVSAGDNVYALHKRSDGQWEICSTVVGDGYVRVTMYSFSAIAIVKFADGEVITPSQVIPDDGNGLPEQKPGDIINNTNNTTNNITNNTTTNNIANSYNTNSSVEKDFERTSAGSSKQKMSPKTGSSIPAIPIIAVFSLMGIAICNKRIRSL